MFTAQLKHMLKQTVVMTAILTAATVLMVIGLRDANAAKPPPQPLSCATSPQDGITGLNV